VAPPFRAPTDRAHDVPLANAWPLATRCRNPSGMPVPGPASRPPLCVSRVSRRRAATGHRVARRPLRTRSPAPRPPPSASHPRPGAPPGGTSLAPLVTSP
jgi:hypothetical protein